MINFFQSPIRHDIKSIVYGEDTFSINLFDKEYFGIKKRKKIWPRSLSRFQVLGIEIPTNNSQWLSEQVHKIYNDYHTQSGNIFFQRWIINEIISFYNMSHRSDDFWLGMNQTRIKLEQQLYEQSGLIPSFRENMPLATVVINTQKNDEELLSEMNSGAKSHVRKAINKDIDFHIAKLNEYQNFYEERYTVSQIKWFNIITKETFLRLMDYLKSNNCGDIFIASKDGVLLWWSIAIYQNDTITYLYGFSNRDERFRNVGVHQFIKYKMFSRARENGFFYMDLFWWAPTWFLKHPLTSVSAFKESLGWTKIERYGNYDIVLNPTTYQISKWWYRKKQKEWR